MKSPVLISGLVLLATVAGLATLACQDEQQSAEAPRDEQQPAEAPKDKAPMDEDVVAYESDTLGAVEVKSVRDNPVDWFDVLQDGKRAYEGNYKLLNNSVELAPGTYVVDVNRTQREVTIEAGKKTVLWTGELIVEGEPAGAYWYPMQGAERRLSSNPPILNASRAFFPGTYTVFVHVSVSVKDTNLGAAEVKAGQKTVLQHAGDSGED